MTTLHSDLESTPLSLTPADLCDCFNFQSSTDVTLLRDFEGWVIKEDTVTA